MRKGSGEKNMRIIAGFHRGRRLKSPPEKKTRPTIDRARESLMSALASARGGTDLEGAAVLDAFAGSGALGLEALSRGARSVQFYENERETFRVLCENVRGLGYEQPAVRITLDNVLITPLRPEPPFDLVFLDPPYSMAVQDVFGLLARADRVGALAEDVVISYEHDAGTDDAVDEQIAASGFELSSRRDYGKTSIDILKREGEKQT